MSLSLIVIPSSALLLPAVATGGDEQIHALRRQVATAIEGLGRDRQIVLVAADPSVSDGARCLHPPDGVVHLGGIGLPAERTTVRAWDSEEIPVGTAHPGVDLSVFAVLAQGHASDPPQLIGLDPATRHADATARHLAELLAAAARTAAIAVICAGDLSAGHGSKPPRPQVNPEDAASFDKAVADLLKGPDPHPTDVLSRAEAVSARGVGSVLVAAHLSHLAGLQQTAITRTQVAGVGGVIATYSGMPDTTNRLGALHANLGEPQ